MKTETAARWWDLPAAVLLVVALLTVATRLVSTRWTEGLTVVQTIVFFGVIAGLAIGQSRFGSGFAGFLAVVYGLFAVPWQLGLTQEPDQLWLDRISNLLGRLNVIIRQLAGQEVVQDSLLFIVLMTALFWVLGVHAGYSLTRHGNAWKAILPTGLTLFVIHSFDALIARRAWYLAVFLFFALVLVARVAYLQQHARWQHSRTALPPHLGLDFIRFTLIATALIVLLAWTAPALADGLPAAERVFQRIRQPWNEVRDRMDNVFASLRSPVGIVSDFYGSSIPMGRGNKLTDSRVFDVHVNGTAPEGLRFYWYGRSFDTYTGAKWDSSASRRRVVNPQDGVELPEEAGRWIGTFEFVAAAPQVTLHTPAMPLWMSRPAQAEVTVSQDGVIDFSTYRARTPLNAGEAYRVQAAVSNATEAQLMAAGIDYPQWVLDRYLLLPDTITPRTRQLAERITRGLETPYEKAIAVTNWLRENITYSETIPSPPVRQEVLDWFLFDLQEGFCNYYAGAEVVLLRSVGVPARWSLGYAQGVKLDDGTYVVRQSDSHAWPEVYFPNIGWVEFEPTASQAPIDRPAGSPDDPNALGSGSDAERRLREELEAELEDQRNRSIGGATLLPPEDIPVEEQQDQRLLWLGASFVAAGLLLYLLYSNRKRFNLAPAPIMMERTLLKLGVRPPERLSIWARRAVLPPLTRSYLEINNALGRLGRRPAINATPSERAEALSSILPPARIPAERLVSEYQLSSFSRKEADLPAALQAGGEIRSLSYRAFFRKLLARFRKPDQ